MKKTAPKKPVTRTAPKRAVAKKPVSAAPKRTLARAPAKASAKTHSASAKKTSGKTAARPPAPIMKRQPTPEEIQHKKYMVQFEGGVRLFNHGDFSKAGETFAALSKATAQDIAERARMYLNICHQRNSRPALKLKTAEDFYNYAVSMANQGNQEEAENSLNKALKLDPKCDYIYYALATTQALRQNVEGALENLQKAIELNTRNRYLAQNDADFENLGEDPRFTELIYPERPIA